ncbi:hypothetical protein [Pseudofrankia sp. DC12]|uniref:hypothetical protein n=1 Tax=Pseudofrankia sp. DC12 TaxID=683315 RepID=UPI0005F867AB|nr:hypothetical protein [Pseudofrankia sp. DC12]
MAKAVTITLPGDQLLTLPVDDPAAMDMVLRATHLLGGWPLVAEKEETLRGDIDDRYGPALTRINKLRARMDEPPDAAALARAAVSTTAALEQSRSALEAWRAAAGRLSPLVADQLAQAEQVGRHLAKQRLDRSAEQIRREAGRYLTGFDDAVFAGDTLEFPSTTRLRPGTGKANPDTDPVADLRAKAHELTTAERTAAGEDAEAALATALAATASLAILAISGLASARAAAAKAVKLAALRGQLAARHPVLFRLELPESLKPGRKDPPTDDELLAALTAAFATTWNAQRAMRPGVDALVIASWDVRHPDGPSAGAAERLRQRGLKGGLASLFDPAFGPWGFPQIMADAAADLAGPGPSLVSQAVQDVYAAVDPSLASTFGECVGTMGAMLALHLVAPPLAVVADVLLAVKGIAEAVVQFLRDRAAYLCALNPADSLGVAPSVLRLALQCAGEVAGALPAGKIATSVSVLAPLAAGLVP